MNIVINILLVVAGIIILLLIVALFMKRNHYVMREIVIHAPQQKIFDYIRLLKNQDNFNKGAMAGNDRDREYKGTDGTVGFVYSWKGDKDAGEGEKEIMSIIEGKRLVAEIRFVKPMRATSIIIMDLEAVSDTQTKVSWSNSGTLNYPINIMIPMLERTLPKGMDESLGLLKDILEK